MHAVIRKQWGYGSEESLTNPSLIKEAYRGIRPAPGYPACPDHTEKGTLWNLLNAEKSALVSLTENFAMNPPCSISGYYFSHPESKYFPVGSIGKDQVTDYAKRKGKPVEWVERWLAPIIDYPT
jgi:5-methyltetrahydrofolate--homocysteine methyltransferase